MKNDVTTDQEVKAPAEKEAKPKSTGRRNFLATGALGVTGAAGLSFPAVSRAQTTTLKMQGAWGAKDIFNEMAQEYVDRVNKMSGGRLKIDYLVSGSVVKAFQLQDAVHKGVLDGGHWVSAYWYGKNKAASLFGTGPVFGQDAHQTLAWIHRGGGNELFHELMESMDLNIVGFFAMPMPTQPLGWFQEPVKSAADLEGLKYRTVGLATDIMESMGVSVTQLPGGEIVPALERGVIEAFEYNNPTSDRRFGAQDVSKNYMMGSYHQAAEFFEIIFNKDTFNSLSEEQQAILEYGAEAASTANYSTAMDQYSKDLQGLINEDGVNVHRTDQSIMDRQLEAWDTVMEDLMQDPFFKKTVDSQREFAHRTAFYMLNNQADYRLAFEHYFPGELA
ncbi:MAG: TRAP transporter substrate-binding protein [Gammaproteobacteria bacterium]|nr:TRAP transporter substrate-binding protein [Gammaproteobacteria bacterium]